MESSIGANVSKPTEIEEEPAHEFYANLTGTNSFYASNKSGNLPLPHSSSPSTTHIIPPSCDEEKVITKKRPNPLTKVYRTSFANPPTLSSISIDSKNKGFRMLQNLGWRETDGGLGRKRQGSLTPIKTQLKRNKRGLGARGSCSKARVTHFPVSVASKADEAIRKASAQSNKRAKRIEIEKKILREKQLASSIRSNLPPEYDAFL